MWVWFYSRTTLNQLYIELKAFVTGQLSINILLKRAICSNCGDFSYISLIFHIFKNVLPHFEEEKLNIH